MNRYSWTVEGRLLSYVRPDGSAEHWRYDGEGNEFEYRDALGRVHRTETTHFDLPAVQTRPDGSRTEFTYDANLRVIRIDDGQGSPWRFEYDPAGQVVREIDTDDRELRYRYDAAGQLIERTNAAGEVTTYTYGALGELVRSESADTRSEFSYDPMGRLLRAVNDDADVEFHRDALGRVLRETVNGSTVDSNYDALGRRIRRVTATGLESLWTYDGRHNHTALRTAGHHTAFDFDIAGRETQRLLDTGTVLAQAWDANHRLRAQTLSAQFGARPITHRRYDYFADSVISAIEDQLTGTRRFTTDPLGRITSGVGRDWQERYAYDRLGNITAGDWPGQDEEARGPREHSGTGVRRAGGVRYERDRQGRVILRQRKILSSKPATWRYQWDSDDRLVGVTTPDGSRWRYRYDALGRRVAKERLAGDGTAIEWLRFIWDGVCLAEQIGSDDRATTWEWQPGTLRPLTQVERKRASEQPQDWVDERFYAIVTDLIGTPTELLDADGSVAWHPVTTVWGKTISPPGPAGTPLRFPGQYHDPETGLHYNHQRYYDPEIGQYVSADPLGAAGGPNTHAYVPNPLVGADPLGLLTCEEKIDNYRSRYKVGKGKNIAVAEYEIDGISGELMGVSGGHRYPGEGPELDNPRFTTHPHRPSDSEWKILEELARTLKPSATGTIHITSELPVCEKSCQKVIDQFMRAFPGIKVTYSDLGRSK